MERQNTDSTINLKELAPYSCNEVYSELEFNRKDPLSNNQPTVTWWIGKNDEDCESRYELILKQGRAKKFEIPGIPYKFIVVSNTLYYRKNVEI